MINLPFSGHTNPTLGLAKSLVECGHKVTYILTNDWKEKIELAGAEFIPYDNNPDFHMKFKNGKPSNLKGSIATWRDAYGTALRIGADYDIILYEVFFFLGKNLADKLKKPAVRQFTTFALNKKIVDELIKTNSAFFAKFRFKLLLRFLTKLICKDIKLSTENFLTEITENPAQLNIVYTSKEFQLYSDEFSDENYTFIGPSISTRESNAYIPFENMNKPIVYILLGTLQNNNKAFYQKCFRAFEKENATVIMSVGKAININKLGTVPDNFMVYPFVPQLEVLQHANLFITHGGMNSINEAMYYGVPMVVIPLDADQYINANRTVELGLAKRIDLKKIEPQLLNDTVMTILSNDKIKDNLQSMKEIMRAAGGSNLAIQKIENYIDSYKIAAIDTEKVKKQ